jgi:hypothetical protein
VNCCTSKVYARAGTSTVGLICFIANNPRARQLGRVETLLVIDVVNSYGVILLQTVWATTGDLRAGHRRTYVERIAEPAIMQHRLRDLVTKIYEPITPTTAALKSDELVGKAHPPAVVKKSAA